MDTTHGTATKHAQFMTVLMAIGTALAVVVEEIGIKAAIAAVNGKVERLTEMLRLVFTALANGQTLVVQMPSIGELPTWRTLKLDHSTLKTLRRALKQAECYVSEWASDIMGKPAFTLAAEPIEIDLVRATVRQLGFAEGARFDAICARALELGLELCPAEVGPQLRLQYSDQPNGEWLIVAMEPITDSGGYLDVFDVERRGVGERWLDASYGDADGFWGPDGEFLFVRPKA